MKLAKLLKYKKVLLPAIVVLYWSIITAPISANTSNNSLFLIPVQKITERALIEAHYVAINRAMYLPENRALKFCLGINSPIPSGSMPDDSIDTLRHSKDKVFGFLARNGQVAPFTKRVLIDLFRAGLRNSGQIIGGSEFDVLKTLLTDVNKSQSYAQRIHPVDLMVENSTDGEIYFIPNVSAYAVKRAALNAVLNDEVEINNYEFKQ